MAPLMTSMPPSLAGTARRAGDMCQCAEFKRHARFPYLSSTMHMHCRLQQAGCEYGMHMLASHSAQTCVIHVG